MRGEVLTFDEATGMGAIAGDDGARYLFAAPEVRSTWPLERGQRVDFVGTDDRQAKEIFALRPAIGASATRRVGAFDLGRVIQRTFTSISRNAAVFFGAALILAGGPSAIMSLGQGMAMTTGETVTASGTSLLLMVLGWMLNLVGMFTLQGMVVKAAVNDFNGKLTAVRDAFDVGVQMFLPLLGLAIVAGVATGLAYILLFVPGLILTVLWSVAAPAVVVEKRGIFESLQRSRDLTRGYRWPVLGLIVIYVILSWIIAGAVGGVSMALGGGFWDGSPNLWWFNLISGVVISVLSGVVASAGVAALYYELRTAKEGAAPDELAAVFD